MVELPLNKEQIRKLAINVSFYAIVLFTLSIFISITASAIFFIIGIISWALSGHLWNSKFKALNFSVLVLFITQLSIALFHHGTEIYVFKDNLKMFAPWFWLTGTLQFVERKKLKLLTFPLIILVGFISILVLLQSQGIFLRSNRGPSGFIYQPMTTSALLMLTTFLSLNYSMKLRTLKNKSAFYLTSFITALQPLALLIMGQRSTLLGLGLGLIIWFFLNLKKLNKLAIFSITSFSVTAPIIAYFSSAKLRRKAKQILQLTNDNGGISCRMKIWQENWQAFLKNPIIGQGKAEHVFCINDTLTHAHNVYLNQLVTYGLIGFAALINFFVFCFIELSKRRHAQIFILGLVAMLIHGLFESWWGDSEITSFFWIFLILGLV